MVVILTTIVLMVRWNPRVHICLYLFFEQVRWMKDNQKPTWKH